jgi:hypothetical protein
MPSRTRPAGNVSKPESHAVSGRRMKTDEGGANAEALRGPRQADPEYGYRSVLVPGGAGGGREHLRALPYHATTCSL